LRSAALQYANALADIAQAQGTSEPLFKELAAFDGLYAESADLRNFLASPAVPRAAKHGAIEKLTTRLGASRIIRNFLFVLTDHRRTQSLPEVAAAFRGVIQQRRGIAQAEISSAVELSAPQKAALAANLERLTGKKVEASYSLNPALLGGAVVRIGSTIYDGSLRSRLNTLRARLAAE
jgi:F-type H+-transporting ATPase subunit delta